MFQHRRRFFRRRAGLLSGAHFCRSGAAGVGIRGTVFYRLYCYRRHSLPGSFFYTGCYPAHNFGEPALESPAQFTAGEGCYRQHNFGAVCIAGQKKWLLSGAQFALFSEGGRLLSTAQFARWVKFGYCYRQHISEFRLLSKRVRTGLLSSAHFRQWGCYRAHSFQTVEFWRLLLSTAHFGKNPPYSAQPVLLYTAQFVFSGAERLLSGAQFAKIRFFLRRVLPWVVSLRTVCPAGAGVVIDGTIQGFFSTGCYSAHISPRQDFSIRPVGMLRTFLTFPFSRPGLLYSTLFKNPTKFSLPPFSCKKTFLLLLRFAHCCVLHICVGMLRTAPL